MNILSRIKKWFEQPAPADDQEGRARGDSIFRHPVRQVARGLRYVALPGLNNSQVTVQSLASADSDLLAVIGDYVDRGGSTPPLLHIGDGVHGKYGFLDVYLRGKSELLTKDAMSGIPLLISLGMISREEDGYVFMCPDDFEQMARDVTQGRTHLRLILVDEEFERAGHQPGMIADYMPQFPIQFRITDACVSNSPYVWRWKHFYL